MARRQGNPRLSPDPRPNADAVREAGLFLQARGKAGPNSVLRLPDCPAGAQLGKRPHREEEARMQTRAKK